MVAGCVVQAFGMCIHRIQDMKTFKCMSKSLIRLALALHGDSRVVAQFANVLE